MDTNKYLDDKGLECLVGNIKKGLAEKQPKGDYATLVGGKLMTWVLPADVDEVLKFSGTVDEVSVALQSLASWKAIVFHKTEKRFYATNWEKVNGRDVALPGQTQKKILKVYENWTTRESYQDITSNLPYSDKIYIDTESNRQYIWKDAQFSLIGSDLVLGHTATTAYPGNEGMTLQERIGKAEKNIKGLGLVIPKMVVMSELEYNQLTKKDPDTYYMLTEE